MPLKRLLSKCVKNGECLEIHSSTNHNGYGRFWLNGKTITAHRASYILHKGAIPKGMCVLHKCDNRLCVNPHHLVLGTIADNVADMVKKDRHPKGSKQGQAKLTEKDIPIIRSMSKKGIPQRKIASHFNVGHRTICDVLYGISWRHV